MAESFYTVSELNHYVKDVINAGFPQAVWVCGEIQQYDRNRSKKHIFFELVEKNPDSHEIIARVGLVIFANRKLVLEGILKKSENAFALKDDIEVKFACKVDFYAPHGALRLIVEDIDPAYTLGRLAQEKQKLIALLTKEGVFEKNKQCLLSPVPLRLGLITSGDSAAYNDFISELTKSAFGFQVFFRNTLMQGKKCEDDVCRALEELRHLPLDAIIITRGGGSLADLSCFDSKKIAYKIAGLEVPVLSGIGHEINLAITDLAAHTFAKTPTAIAQFLVQAVEDYLSAIDRLTGQVADTAKARLEREKQTLKQMAGGLQEFLSEYFKQHRENIIRYAEILRQHPRVLVENAKRSLAQASVALKKGSDAFLAKSKNTLEAYAKWIDIVDPVNTLKRGFSITRVRGGELLKSQSQAQEGIPLETELADGRVISVVTNAEEQK